MKYRKSFGMLCPMLAVLALPVAAADNPAGNAKRYLDTVRRYADAMIEHGRDEYGEVKSPLFAVTLDRQRLKLPDKSPGDISGIRNIDRTIGANPMHDQNFYQLLYALTRATDDSRYAAQADTALKWFFEHCQSPKGLMAWGEHQGWSFLKEAPSAPQAPHEYFRPWVLWERCFKLAPKPCHNFSIGLWNHQISDHQTGAFSRHAVNIWDNLRASPDKGWEFPRHGGFYIATWAIAYEHTRDKDMLKAIECLVASFQARRNGATGIIPAESRTLELAWPQSNLSLAIDLWASAPRVPEKIAEKMRACAAGIDDTFLAIKHDLSSDGKGFLKAVRASTLEATDTYAVRGTKKPGAPLDSHTRTWETGYGDATDAQVAMLCLLRSQQARKADYERLFLAAAERYLKRDPDLTIALYPGALGEAIAVMLGAYRLTHELKFLERADAFADTALDVFWKDSPLPRASSKNDHYEAITRGDTLAMVLLELWAAHAAPATDLHLIWTDR
jgi:hypothetical protein